MSKYIYLSITVLIVSLLISHFVHSPSSIPDINWEKAVNPGDLSDGHAFMEGDCLGCHTPMTGVTRDNCVACHANDTHMLQRQPTAFHIDVTECAGCHQEHQGKFTSISVMDHKVLFDVGLSMVSNPSIWLDEEKAGKITLSNSMVNLQRPEPLFIHADVSSEEATLNCASCHANDDRHLGLFAEDCVQCHITTSWSIPEFKHPSTKSLDCNQCHEAPPSHYMQHFKMISATVAGEPNAKVEECYACHQSTSWNDIKKAGWYKHH